MGIRAWVANNVAVRGGINEVTVTDTPATGEVLKATSSSAASWQPDSGGGGGAVSSVDGQTGAVDLSDVYAPTPEVGAPQSYTFTLADTPEGGSFWRFGLAKLFMTWTPAVSGSVLLLPPSDIDDPNYAASHYFIWKGTVANVDYPDLTAASGTFGNAHSHTGTDLGIAVKSNPERDLPQIAVPFRVTAGQAYTVFLFAEVDAEELPTLNLDGLLVSLAAFGGIDDPPPPRPEGYAYGVTALPDGTLAYRPGPIDDAAEFPFAHEEGCGSVATGVGSHAEGYDNVASGLYSHAEGGDTVASAVGSHAEGGDTVASGPYSHAEGSGTTASGFGTRASGAGAVAARYAEQAEGIAGFASAPIQCSRLILRAATIADTPAVLSFGDGGAVDLPLTDNTLSVVAATIGAVVTDIAEGAVAVVGDAASWEASATVSRTAGTSRLVGSPSVAVTDADASAASWEVAVTASTVGIAVTVTGDVATGIRWVAGVRIVEVPLG